MLELSNEEKRELLRLARQTITRFVLAGERSEYRPSSSLLEEKAGAFVTLRSKGRLRGCIGYTQPTKPLYETVIDCTISAASEDPRFSPVLPEELEQIEIEISVLSAFRPISSIDEIEIGVHGLMVSRGALRGLLLPQVAVEFGWDRKAFLEHACLKGGLDKDDWSRGATIEIFSALVFSERDFMMAADGGATSSC